MHIWDDNQSSKMHHHKLWSLKKMDYSHCPLKKRPVHFVKNVKEEMDFDNTNDYNEPENLSTKPQDLSVKCKSESATEPISISWYVKKEEPQSPGYHQNVAAPFSSPTPAYHHHHHHQQPYQPTAIKPGPLEPLCLNIAADHHPTAATMTPSVLTTATYNHHNRLDVPATPRPVPAQYPGTGYLSSYVYHNHPHGGLTTMMDTGSSWDASPSPPGSGTGSAFKPLHSSPSTAPSHSPPATMSPWYSRGSVDGLSPQSYNGQPLIMLQSPPLPPPPPAIRLSPQPSLYQMQQHCSPVGESDAGSSSASVVSIETGIFKPKPIVPSPSANSTRYKCPSCTKTYSTVSGLTKHQQYHCSENDGTSSAAAAAPKTFCCKYCDKAYNTLGALKMHIRTHTLPCLCKLCGKAFSRPWLLQGHIRTHTGEKPFSCQHCNRAFADRSNLRAHLQTHSDVKKYSCQTCSKTFSRMSLLTKHCDTGCPQLQQQPQQQQQQHPQQ